MRVPSSRSGTEQTRAQIFDQNAAGTDRCDARARTDTARDGTPALACGTRSVGVWRAARGLVQLAPTAVRGRRMREAVAAAVFPRFGREGTRRGRAGI